MDAQIHGTVLPVLELTLNPGDTIVSEAGEMSWMSQSIEMTTTTQTAGAKGVMGVLKRAVAGGGIFMTEFRSPNGAGSVSFATKMPGQIMPVQVTKVPPSISTTSEAWAKSGSCPASPAKTTRKFD